MVDIEKKAWSTPRLRVFVRTRTEEKVLENCKFGGNNQGSLGYDSKCLFSRWCINPCSSAASS